MAQRISNSPLDPLIGPIFQRAYPWLRIPRRFPPEGIVLAGHLSAVIGAVGLAYSLRSPWFAILGVIGIIGNHFADCLDGTHARRTEQCRHGGELLDHFTDPLSFSYWLVGIGAAIGRLDWTLAAVIVLFSQAVLTNIKAKLTGNFVLSAFGPTEFKLLLCLAGGSLAIAQFAAVPTAVVGASMTLFFQGLIVLGGMQLGLNLVCAVRDVNRSLAPVDTSEWVIGNRD